MVRRAKHQGVIVAERTAVLVIHFLVNGERRESLNYTIIALAEGHRSNCVLPCAQFETFKTGPHSNFKD